MQPITETTNLIAEQDMQAVEIAIIHKDNVVAILVDFINNILGIALISLIMPSITLIIFITAYPFSAADIKIIINIILVLQGVITLITILIFIASAYQRGNVSEVFRAIILFLTLVPMGLYAIMLIYPLFNILYVIIVAQVAMLIIAILHPVATVIKRISAIR